MDRALGLIEVIGFPPAIEAADAALKAANIKLGGITKVGSGIVTIQLFGDVGAIKAAVEAGGKSASRIGTVRATHIIPRVDESLISSKIIANKEENKIKSQTADENTVATQKVESAESNKTDKFKVTINDKAVTESGTEVTNREKVSNTVEEDITVLNGTTVLKDTPVQNNITISKDTTLSDATVLNTGVKEPEVQDKKDNIANRDDEKDHLKDEKDHLKDGKDHLKDEKDHLKENFVETNHGKAAVEESVLNGLSLEEIRKKSVTELRTLIQSLGRPINSKKLNSAKKEDLIKYITDYIDRKKGDV